MSCTALEINQWQYLCEAGFHYMSHWVQEASPNIYNSTNSQNTSNLVGPILSKSTFHGKYLEVNKKFFFLY